NTMPSVVAWASRALAVGDAEQAASRSKAADPMGEASAGSDTQTQLIWLRTSVKRQRSPVSQVVLCPSRACLSSSGRQWRAGTLRAALGNFRHSGTVHSDRRSAMRLANDAAPLWPAIAIGGCQ